jgi:aminopeptidase N
MKKSISVFIAVLALTISVLFAQPMYHQIDASVSPNNHFLQVVDTITFSAADVGAGDSLVFYLNPNLAINRMQGNYTFVKTAKQDRQPEALRYALLHAGEKNRRVVIAYSGQIDDALSTGAAEYARGFSDTKGIISPKGVYLAGSSYWIPAFRQPLFTYDLTVRLPGQWLAVSQGVRVVMDTLHGQRVLRFVCRHPQDQAYLTANTWTEYDTTAGRVKVQAFLRHPDQKLALRYLDMTGVYLNMYVRLLGPYPYSKFALVENFWETGYGMPSFTLLGSRIIRFPFILYSSYPHELLHNWWGNSVYVAMKKGNWSEGLTAYMADHMLKEQRGQGAEYRRSTLQKFTDFVNSQNDFPVVDFRERHNAAEEAIGYGKSLMFQHMLRQMVGDSLYIQAYRRFYKDYRFKIASFDDIRTTFETVTGRDLKPFFDEWLKRKGAPQIKMSEVKVFREHEDYLLSFRLSQIQKEAVFPMTIPVAVFFEDTVVKRKVFMRHRDMYPLFRFDKPPLRIEVDPQFDVFRRLDKGEAPPSLTQLFGNTNVTLILPAKSPYLSEYRKLAKVWKQTAEVQNKHFTIVTDSGLRHLPGKGAVWVIGFENRFAGMFDIRKHFARYFSSSQLEKMDSLQQTGAVVLVTPRSSRPDQTLGFVGTRVAASVSGLARLLPHYGKYSWLGFVGKRPQNVLKGTFPPMHSPLHFDFQVKGAPRGINAQLTAERPLIRLQPAH